ncbi:MAG: glycosyltransferase WbuB [Peptococcaceae bacterium]|jgi:glycosyltransferase involved in cell wall biosynthesis|nr:MAG: glycosyltransferase WbuB [Peptococcaceae bacterium]
MGKKDTGCNRSLWILNHHATGPGRHEGFARELAARGWRVKIFAASFMHNLFRELKIYPPGVNCLLEENGIERVWIKAPPYFSNGVRRLFNQLVFARRSWLAGRGMDRPGIILGSSVHLFAGLAGLFLARRHKVPFVFEVRDFWPQVLVDMGVLRRGGSAERLMGWLESFLYSKAGRIIYVPPGGADYLAGRGVEREKTVYIPNGVDLAWFDRCLADDCLDPELARFFGECQDKMLFVYTGAHGRANGLDVLVKAAAVVQQAGEQRIHFLLVGEGPEKPALEKLAGEYGLCNLTFRPGVPKDMVPLIIKRAAGCILSLEAGGAFRYGISFNKLFDYLAGSRPVVAAAPAGLALLEQAGSVIRVAPGDPPALAGAVVELARTAPGERLGIGLAGRRYVERHHSMPVLAGKLEKVLEELL